MQKTPTCATRHRCSEPYSGVPHLHEHPIVHTVCHASRCPDFVAEAADRAHEVYRSCETCKSRRLPPELRRCSGCSDDKPNWEPM